MKKIVIDVQLAPCEVGVDIFTPTDRLTKVSNYPHYRGEDGSSRAIAMRTEEFPELALVTKPVKATLTIEVPREEGFYWVDRHSDGQEHDWVVRYWNGINFGDGEGGQWGEHVYTIIDERKIERAAE